MTLDIPVINMVLSYQQFIIKSASLFRINNLLPIFEEFVKNLL